MTSPQIYGANPTSDVTLTTTSETVIATVDGVTTGASRRTVDLEGTAQITTGAATTGLIFRFRRGTTVSGTLVGEANTVQVSAAAGSTEDHTHVVTDLPGELVGGSYVLTVQQVAATGNGASVQAHARATVR